MENKNLGIGYYIIYSAKAVSDYFRMLVMWLVPCGLNYYGSTKLKTFRRWCNLLYISRLKTPSRFFD